jgi:multisubunit Na+/H+ antiporter MnhB subunit
VTAAFAFDLLLCALIVAVALSAVVARDLLAAIVLFIVYGLLVAVAWVRLEAVDVALAEAAIGAGLTGILLVGAAGRLRRGGERRHTEVAWNMARMAARVGQFTLCAAGVAVLAALVLTFPESPGLIPQVRDNIAAAGVTHPVTAVLLNFRAYDTLLEAILLVIALVGVWSLTPDRFWGGVPGMRQHVRRDGVLAYFGRVLPAIGLLVGIHLLWAGSTAPGGAFQAGTVLAAVWLLVAMAGLTEPPSVTSTGLRLLLVVGPGLFLLIGAIGALAGMFLAYPVDLAKPLILAIEIALTASIAATLSLVILGVPRRVP